MGFPSFNEKTWIPFCLTRKPAGGKTKDVPLENRFAKGTSEASLLLVAKIGEQLLVKFLSLLDLGIVLFRTPPE